MKAEERNKGTVQLSTYSSYCKAAGGLFLVYWRFVSRILEVSFSYTG